jgi:ATP-binding cassette, subfamily C (CFTR/MRP), member 1
MLFSLPPLVFNLYWIQRFYLRTSRQIRLLDLEAKTPMYRHFTETLEGLAVIRSFGWQAKFENEAINSLEESQKPYYLMFSIPLWLTVSLELMASALTVMLTTLALLIPQSSDPGSLGVGLTTTFLIAGSLQSMVNTWADVETSLGSIARTRSYERETPNENTGDTMEPASTWPDGELHVTSLIVTYQNGTKGLGSVDLDIRRGQKLGICGRTGRKADVYRRFDCQGLTICSGKSTFLSVLLRLIDPTSGEVSVDAIDITKIPRNTVREKLVCLPQDPILLPGTFQYNLDPQARISDLKVIEDVLKSVRMWEVVEIKGGLNAELTLDSLSHGEQQLLALARAILKNKAAAGKCILVLDEATSNLDTETEAVVQMAVAEEFKDNTVIAIAHRLETLRSFDKIVVLDKGEVAKVGAAKDVIAEMSEV